MSHGLHHTFTTALRKAGCDPYVIKRLREDSGHVDPELTMVDHYCHYSDEECLHEYLRKMSRLGITPFV
jgi:integrase